MGRFKTHEERARKKQYRREAQKQKETNELLTRKEFLESKAKTPVKKPSVVQFRLPNKIG